MCLAKPWAALISPGLCGVFLGGALAGVPVLADGFISGVAALCAVRLCPAAAKAVFASHCLWQSLPRASCWKHSARHRIITAGLHLGEGTGAVASIPLWDMALAGLRRRAIPLPRAASRRTRPQC